MATKVCKKCDQEKALELFHKAKTKDGREVACKACRKFQRPKHIKTCNTCNKTFESNEKDSMFCSRECMGQYKAYDFDYVYKYFQDNMCTLLEKEYKNANTKMKYKCECGNISEITFYSFKDKGSRCSVCRNNKIANKIRKYNIDDVKDDFKRAGLILLEETYTNNLKPMNYICECGRKSKISYADFLNGNRCRKCGFEKSAIKQRFDFGYVDLECKKKGFKLLDRKYLGANHPMEVECLKCKKTSAKSFYWIRKGSKCAHCHLQENRGENHPSWNHSLTTEERITRRVYTEYQEWRSKVFKRDEYICRCCGVKGGKIVAHHLDGYNWCVEKRTDIDNGVTLCDKCHNAKYPGSFHNVYGNGNNTREQYTEWIRHKRNKDAI